jgi:hypothetical protein
MNAPLASAIEQAARLADGQKLDADALRELDPQVARGLQRLSDLHRVMAMDAPMGASWGHLHQLDFVAQGGFGDVYRAYDPTLERTVALKLRRDDLPVVISSGRDLLAEARRLARVRHPHVLAVHGASYHSGRAGIWADWIDGETLQQYLLHATPTPAELLIWGRELASALAAIHEAALVHGDIKASNVMRDRRGHMVLMDFGAGFASDGAGATLGAGTPRYLAPEVMAGQAPTSAIDIYSLGVLIHWLGTRHYPVAGQVHPALQPRALRQLVQRMLTRDPLQRPNARELSAQLRQIEQVPLLRARRLAALTAAGALIAVSLVSTIAYQRAHRAQMQAQNALAHADTTNRFLTDLIERASAGALGPTASLRDLLDAAPGMVQQRFADRPGDRSRLLHLLSELELSLSNDERAGQLAAEAAAAARADAADADSTLMLAGDALRLNALDQPEAKLAQARALLQRARDEQRSPNLIAYLDYSLFEVDYQQSITQSTAAVQRRLLQNAQRLLAHGDLLDAGALTLLWRRRSNLEVVAGDFDAAMVSAQQSVAIAEATYGTEHPRTAISRSVLGWMLLSMGKAPEAERLFTRNIEMHEKKVGRHSRIIVDYQMGLAYALLVQGKNLRALRLAEEALPVSLELYGPLHRNTIDATLTLGQTQLATGRAGDVVHLLAPLRGRMLAAAQNENRHYMQVLELLAGAQLVLMETADSLASLDECAEVGSRALGVDNALSQRCTRLAAALRTAMAAQRVPRDIDRLLEPVAE